VSHHWGLFRGLDPLAPGNAAYTLMWVAVGHFLQYLWFTTYLSAAAEPLAGRLRYFGKVLLAGAALWVLPTLIFAPGLLGQLPYDFGLAVMAAAMVNLHHFVLDGLIWKTSSSGRLSRWVTVTDRPDPLGAPRRWPAGLVWVTGAACLAIAFVGYWESEFGFRRAAESQDYERFRRAVERSAWIGRDSPGHHTQLARLALANKNPGKARRELERSLALHPTAAAWAVLGSLHEQASQWDEAIEAYRSAVELDPRDAGSLYRIGLLWLRQGDAARARDALKRAAELAPGNRLIPLSLERAEALLRESQVPAASADTASSQ